MLTAERITRTIPRLDLLFVALLAVLSWHFTEPAHTAAADLWTYTGNDPGRDEVFHIRSVALTADATHIATFAEQFGSDLPKDPNYAVWDFVTGKQLAAWQTQHWSVAMAISNDAKLVVSLGHAAPQFNTVRSMCLVVWQASNGKELFRYDVPPGSSQIKQFEKIKFSADNKSIYWLGSTTAVLDRRTGKLFPLGAKQSSPTDADFAPSNGRFAWLGDDVLEIYQSIDHFGRNQAPQHRIKMPHPANEIRLSDDGRTVMASLIPAEGDDAEKQFLGAWDAASGQRLQLYDFKWPAFDYWRNFVVSHDGKFAAGTHGSRDLLWIYDLERNTATDFQQEAMGSLGFTPGGTLMARVPSSALKFLDAAALKAVATPLTEAQRTGRGAAQRSEKPVAGTEPKPAAPMIRTWTSANGKFTVEASLFRVQDDSVVLLRKDGKVITVPLTQLSAQDRRYVQSQR